MQRADFKPISIDPNNKYLSFQPRVHSRQYNKSKSSKKNHLNRNIIAPCEPLGDKLLKAALQKNQRKAISHNNNNNRREKTEESMMERSMTVEGSRCCNHPDKKGEYFLESQPNKKFCLKCNLTLNGGNIMTFVTNQKFEKKQTLDAFKQQLSGLKQQIQNSKQMLHQSIQKSEQKFSQHSAYISESFMMIKQQVDQKRRQLQNSLIIAQQNLKQVYEQNLKKLKKMTRSIEKYQFDIKKFYDEIIDQLPKSEFDHIMEEYQNKINKNFRSKLKSMLFQDGVCVYIPNLEMKNIIEKASVEFYLPVNTQRDQQKENLSFYAVNEGIEQKKSGSNSLDSKLHEFGHHPQNDRRPVTNFHIPQKKQEVDLNLFERRTGNFVSPKKDEFKHRLIEDKENINLQNFSHDYYNPKPDNFAKFTFKA